ncbi:hypothetical protein I203_102354 [Kwoniella mangroviensis CBS 8507]|uniref:uncharacterized protein n=1 Tax=Kwoniella mangroviensis CBS 8507 TaxID=1296122 RepID=UPI00080D848C|nr:uncharacterized protein I203_06474 [Kwoniella mangroviensis CBS 8507]OCF64293.1 hypothetical protein I203_06474 [Kwoniella mangroviensis CBS 8507]
MRNINITFYPLLTLLVSYVAASPIYESRQLVPRGTAPLWNESGPNVRDVKQVKVLNCWWAASSLAVLISSQQWIENMVKYGNGSSMVGQSWPTDSTVQVTVWNPNSGQQQTFETDHDYISQTEDHPDGNWWHDAVGQGAKAMGKTDSFAGVISGENPDWDPESGSAKIGLKILTGFETESKYREFISVDEFFSYCEKASSGTPVIFNTLSKDDVKTTVPQLGHSHDYAVYNGTTNSDGDRVIWARNSWGSTDMFKLSDVYENSYQIVHLRDWNVLGGGPFDTTHQDGSSADTNANATTSANATDSATSTGVGNDTATATATTDAAGNNSTATAVDNTASTTVSDADASTSSAPGQPVTSQPAGTSAAAPATASSSATAPETSSGGSTSSPWQWTSILPGWSTTYPSTPSATNQGLVVIEAALTPESDEEERSEDEDGNVECKWNNADGACQ